MISLKFIEIPYDSGGSKLTRPRTQAVRTKATKFPSIRYKEEGGGGGGGGGEEEEEEEEEEGGGEGGEGGGGGGEEEEE